MTDTLTAPESVATESRSTKRRARLALAVTLVFGVLVNLALQTRAGGAAGALWVAVLVGCFIGFGEVTTASGRVLFGAALLPGAFLFVSASPWVVGPSLVAVAFLLALGVAVARRGSILDLGFLGAMRRVVRTIGSTVTAPRYVGAIAGTAMPANEDRRRQGAGVVRGLLLAVPVVFVLGLLLASADGVFASLIDVSIDPVAVTRHLVVILMASMVALGLFIRSSRSAVSGGPGRRLRIGSTEGAFVLSALVAVYSLYAVARVLVAMRGTAYVLEETGLTYAEYARSGFFQLLWAAGITLVVLLGLRSSVEVTSTRGRRTIDGLSIAAVALTLVVVQTAISRLGLYDEAFGLTMLRLYSSLFAWWVGSVFALVGVAVVFRRAARWLPAATMGAGLVGLVVLFALGPERLVIERNVERAMAHEDFDVDYALGLSDDAIPTLVDSLPRLPDGDRMAAEQALCERHDGVPTTSRTRDRRTQEVGPTPWNLGSLRAGAVLSDLCEG